MHRHASLNRVYRLVWSQVHRTWVVVSETARGRGKRASRKLLLATAATALATANLAQAGPTGGQVTAGSGNISRAGDTTTIHQSSQKLSLAWQSFNTNAGETVNFVQPSASAIAVNRIFDSNGTRFMGNLNANGQVYVINPNGVLFGAGSQVNVGGLVASTLDVADSAAGSAARRFSGPGTGAIVNQGSINAAEGGYVAFVGNVVSNQGSVVAPSGSLALGAGSDVTLAFAGNSLVNMQVNRSTLNNLAENGGLLRADGGAVLLSAGGRDAVLASVVNNTGVIEARAVRNVGGTIVLEGGQASQVGNTGTLDASARDVAASGGVVKVLGEQVSLGGASRIDVSGQNGGGAAYVGGNFLGAGPERNALTTTVAAGSSIAADALVAGDGGRVALWSDGATRFDGAISARGAGSGSGGAVETSGKYLGISGKARVDTGAALGKGGQWLLDPADITIGSIAFFGNNYGIDVDSAVVTEALNHGNVTIKTAPGAAAGNGDITLLDTIGTSVSAYDAQHSASFTQWTSNDYTLTLSAFRDIRFAYVQDYYSAGAGTTQSSGGGIDLSGNPTGGRVVLRADHSGTGTGTVRLDNTDWNFFAFGNGNSKADIFYNPTSYAAPTDFSVHVFPGFGNASQVTGYQAVNIASVVANKTYDGTNVAAVGGVTTLQSPAGVTVSTGNAVATFVDKNAGQNKEVTLSGIVFDGAGGDGTRITHNGNNYYLNGLDNRYATISKLDTSLTGISASGKTYDGTTAASISGTAQVNKLGGDDLQVSGTGAGSFFNDKNAGAGKGVTVAGYSLSGLDANNYNLVMPTGLTADIGKADISITGLSANSKTYDSTIAATLSGTATATPLLGDVVWVGGSGAASFADKNAGANKAVTVTGYTLGGTDAGNYNLIQPSGLSATINRANVVVTGVGANAKTYDATTAVFLNGTASVQGFGGDQLSVGGTGTGMFADKNAGAGKSVLVSGYTLGGLDAGNYNLVQPVGVTATINKANLVLSGLTALNKTYDGTTAATLSGVASVNPVGADIVTLSGSGSGVFADKNAGSGKQVTVVGYTLGGLDGGNYNLVAPANLTADIARAGLAVSGIVANSKTYDGTAAATVSGSAQVSAIGGDVVAVAGSGVASFADKNAGTGKAVTVGGYVLTGADADNYTVVQPSGLSATINKAGLALSGISVADKVYDGTTAATLSGQAGVSAIGADQVDVTGSGSAAFNDKNAGAGKTVTVTGYALSGLDAGNYFLLPSGGLSATIAKANLELSGLNVQNKVYDGTVAATLSGNGSVTAIGSDVVSLSGAAQATFNDKNAGSAKAATLSGLTLTGADAGNYTLVQAAGFGADIARAGLAVTGVQANNKTYDGGVAATLSGTAAVAGFGSDQVSVAGSGNATFTDKNAGAGKQVNVSGYTLSGGDAANYEAIQPTGLTATIDRAALALQGVRVLDKVYDATTGATLDGVAGVTAIGADQVTVAGQGQAVFADKNAGIGKAVTVSGYTLQGNDAGNYTLLPAVGLSATIARANLVVSGLNANSRVYDGSTAATLSGTAAVAALGEDVVALGGSASGAFADKNAGTGKAVTVSGLTLTGADAGNYNLVLPAGLSADIARAGLAVTGVQANNKTYDGGVAATLTGEATVAAIGADQVSVTGNGSAVFADKNAGSEKLVTVSGYTLSGLDAGNYEVIQPAGLRADIARAALALQGVRVLDKVYDAGTGATLDGVAAVNGFGADQVSVGGQGQAVFADKNAGVGKAVLVSGYTLQGADAGNYTLLPAAGLSATIARANLAVSGLNANSRVYDGSTAATLSGTAAVAALGEDVVALGGNASGAFADKNAGNGKAVTVSGLTLTGADAGNYNLVLPAGLSADIARAGLAVTGVRANDKTYDGGVAATLSGDATVAAFGNDQVSVGGDASAVFADKNAGADKQVSASGYTLSGADAANYEVIQPTGLTASIDRAALALQGVRVLDKVYDASTGATLEGAASVNGFGADQVTVAGQGQAVFADKNAGTGKAVTVSGYTLQGSDAGNYVLLPAAGLSASIARADLTLGGVRANNRVYDGTTAATLSGTAAVAALGQDAVTVDGSGSARFADKNAGNGKAVTLSGYTLGGADAGNYTLRLPTGLTADIAKAGLSVSGITARNKTFDGGVSATVDTANVAFGGRIGADDIRVASTGQFADSAVGTGKTVNLSNTYSGADLANYTIVSDQATAQASIAEAPPAANPLRDVVAQVQSFVLPPQSSARPDVLGVSSTLRVIDADAGTFAGATTTTTTSSAAGATSDDSGTERSTRPFSIDTTVGAGQGAPRLQIQNGGMQLPPLASINAE